MSIKRKIIELFIDKIADTFNGVFIAIFALFLGLFVTKDVLTKQITALSDLLFTKNIIISPFYIFIGFILLLSILLFFVFIIFKPKSNNKVILQQNKEPEQQFDFEAIYEECSYKLLKNEVCYERKIKIKALKDNFKRFPFSFDYTDFKVIPLIDGDDIVYIDNSGYYNNYQYVLQSHIMKDETADIHIRMTYENNNLVKHFFGKTIKYPIKTLCLKFYFDKSIKVTSIIRTHYEYYESKNILFTKPYKPNNDRQHEWIIDEPSLENYFRLSWKKVSER